MQCRNNRAIQKNYPYHLINYPHKIEKSSIRRCSVVKPQLLLIKKNLKELIMEAKQIAQNKQKISKTLLVNFILKWILCYISIYSCYTHTGHVYKYIYCLKRTTSAQHTLLKTSMAMPWNFEFVFFIVNVVMLSA